MVAFYLNLFVFQINIPDCVWFKLSYSFDSIFQGNWFFVFLKPEPLLFVKHNIGYQKKLFVELCVELHALNNKSG